MPIDFLETSWRWRWDGTDIYGTFNDIRCGINYNLSPLLIPMGLKSGKVENSYCRKIDVKYLVINIVNSSFLGNISVGVSLSTKVAGVSLLNLFLMVSCDMVGRRGRGSL